MAAWKPALSSWSRSHSLIAHRVEAGGNGEAVRAQARRERGQLVGRGTLRAAVGAGGEGDRGGDRGGSGGGGDDGGKSLHALQWTARR